MEERSNVGAEVEMLSKNQKKLLTVLSRTNGTYSSLGNDFIQLAKMSKASLDQSLTFLERHDYINKTHDGFCERVRSSHQSSTIRNILKDNS